MILVEPRKDWVPGAEGGSFVLPMVVFSGVLRVSLKWRWVASGFRILPDFAGLCRVKCCILFVCNTSKITGSHEVEGSNPSRSTIPTPSFSIDC